MQRDIRPRTLIQAEKVDLDHHDPYPAHLDLLHYISSIIITYE